MPGLRVNPAVIRTAAVVAWSLALYPSAAQAYIDPGAGSMTLQLLLGGIAGLLMLVKTYWKRLWGRKKAGKKDDDLPS